MVSHNELATRFKEGATKGKGFNMFIEGNTIYSYGHHFPIAVRKEGYYLFNSDGYSSSTAKHKSYVLRELGESKIIFLPSCDIERKDKQIRHNNEEITDLKDKLTRMRTEHTKKYAQERIKELLKQNKLINEVQKMNEKEEDEYCNNPYCLKQGCNGECQNEL